MGDARDGATFSFRCSDCGQASLVHGAAAIARCRHCGCRYEIVEPVDSARDGAEVFQPMILVSAREVERIAQRRRRGFALQFTGLRNRSISVAQFLAWLERIEDNFHHEQEALLRNFSAVGPKCGLEGARLWGEVFDTLKQLEGAGGLSEILEMADYVMDAANNNLRDAVLAPAARWSPPRSDDADPGDSGACGAPLRPRPAPVGGRAAKELTAIG